MSTERDGADPDGRLADNIAFFARTLRKAGLRIGPASTLTAIDAAEAAGLSSRDDFFWALHSVFVMRREDEAVFAETFRQFWRSRQLVEKMIAMFSSMAPPRETAPEKKRPGERRVDEALAEGARREPRMQDTPVLEIDARLTVSRDEILRAKDFAQMSAAEIERAKRAIAALELPEDRVATRRYRMDAARGRLDPRRMLQASMRTGGDLVLPRYRARREVHPPLVVIADISGSMSQYSRIFLHFLHAVTARRRRVRTFLFGTRLTNVTRELTSRDPDAAIDRCAGAVADWSGGTRIGEALETFNKRWSRRVLSGGAVVLLITDGLERDDIDTLSREMARLHRSSRRLIWLNPLLRFEGFSARARGVRAMLPHVDEFRSVHSLDAMEDLCRALSAAPSGGSLDPRRWLLDDPAAQAA
ncbi:VWA domain-containing protein [Aureimonas sp. AU12]|uniref:vWA domain-containing protein n=1 Tax=Aureimonas sp. AU12 TaxID=1638161 RepID=UPI000780E78E|nr:VWA domain-containing protein [Aureimonas sp. AU12]